MLRGGSGEGGRRLTVLMDTKGLSVDRKPVETRYCREMGLEIVGPYAEAESRGQ